MSKQKPTKGHHYVPCRYLNAWCNSSGVLAVRPHDGQPFETKPTSVCFENGLYSFSPIRSKEFSDMLHLTLQVEDEEEKKFLRSILQTQVFSAVFRSIKDHRCINRNAREIVEVAIQNNILEEQEVCSIVSMDYDCSLHLPEEQRHVERAMKYIIEGEEPFMCDVEEQFWPILQKLLDGDESIVLSDEETSRFIIYAIVQIARTPRIFSLFEKSFPAYQNHKRFLVYKWLGEHVANLIRQQECFELTLIINQTQTEFITGDIPLLNLSSAGHNSPHFDLYFPISPVKAVFFSEKKRREIAFPSFQNPDCGTIDSLNHALCNNCMKMLFATRTTYLHQYMIHENPHP